MTEIRWHEGTALHMQIKENKGVTWLTYPAFEQFKDIVHGFSTRLGGVSKGIYASMNLSFTRGDEDAAVRENYRRFAAALGFSEKDIVTSDQTHTANVRIVTDEDRGNGITKPRPYTDVDGMITNVRGLVLATFYADCVPLYFIDPVHHAIGLSHSGWRGTVSKIGAVTVKKMQETYGTDPKDFYKKENGKYQLNLWEANKIIFMETGITENHISMPGICTCCNPEFLFSHRASHGKRGNLGAFLGLK